MEANESPTEGRDPLPARPLPAPPLPVQSLDYSTPSASRRPGILTAVGVMSIVIGSLSALMGCSSVFMLVVMQFVQRAAPAPAAGAAAGPGGAAAMFPIAPMNVPSLVLGGFEALLRLGLALMLIVGGVLVLRDNSLARRLHLIWAWIKIPSTLLAAVVGWQQTRGMFAAMPATPGSPVTPQYMDMMMIVGMLVQAAIACAYPVGVLIVMKTRTVRDYYGTELGATGA